MQSRTGPQNVSHDVLKSTSAFLCWTGVVRLSYDVSAVIKAEILTALSERKCAPSSRRPDPPARPKNEREHRGSSGRGRRSRAKRAAASPALESISTPAQDPTPSSFSSARGSVRSPIAVKSFHSPRTRIPTKPLCEIPDLRALCTLENPPPSPPGHGGGEDLDLLRRDAREGEELPPRA